MTPSVLSNMNSLPVLADARWFRPGVSTTAHNVDQLFFFISIVCVAFFVLVIALMVWFMWIYRKRQGHREQYSPHHNNALEVTWSVIPLLLVIGIFYMGFTGYIDMQNAPADAYEIEVEASKWQWSFRYPNGATSPVLHVPADRPVKLILASKDVLHSLYIPAFRVKMDCVPGRYTYMWFEIPGEYTSDKFKDPTFDNDMANQVKYSDGSATYADADPSIGYDLFCTEYCGTGHSSMITKCVVHTEAEFEQQLRILNDPRSQGTPVEVGEKIYKQRGCSQCHSIDGVDKPGVGGPSFKGYYGKQIEFKDGTTGTMDDQYIRESILNPTAKIRAGGYGAIMPTFQGQLGDDEIYAIRQYIRSLNDETAEEWEPKEGEEGEAAEGEPAAAADAEGETPDEPEANADNVEEADAGGEGDAEADDPTESDGESAT